MAVVINIIDVSLFLNILIVYINSNYILNNAHHGQQVMLTFVSSTLTRIFLFILVPLSVFRTGIHMCILRKFRIFNKKNFQTTLVSNYTNYFVLNVSFNYPKSITIKSFTELARRGNRIVS